MKKEIEAKIWSDISKKQMSSWGKWLYLLAALGFGWVMLTVMLTDNRRTLTDDQRGQQNLGIVFTAITAAGGYMLRRRGGYVSLVNTYQEACSSLLGGKVDYWYADQLSAIAVSVADGKLAMVEDQGLAGAKIILGAYTADQITNMQQMVGMRANPSGDFADNFAQNIHVAQNNGLRVYVSDIDTPQFRIRMGERSGDKWSELLNQMIAGTLPPSPQPRRIA